MSQLLDSSLSSSSIVSSSSGSELETEIRKLKLELLKEELDDKLLTFKAYLERKQRVMQVNQTAMTTMLNQSTTSQEDRQFSSVLFANVVGDLEVWHFVFLIFFSWIFLIILISYVRKRINYYKQKVKRKNTLKSKKKNNFKRLKENEYKADNLFKVTQLQDNEYENIDLNKHVVTTTTTTTNVDYTTVLKSTEETTTTHTLAEKPFEFDESFLPSKRDFFLYTISEHEQLTKKTFSYKKKPKNNTLIAKLSKSDPNLAAKGV